MPGGAHGPAFVTTPICSMNPVPDPELLRLVPHRPPILRLERILTATADAATTAGREPTGPGALPWACGAIEGLAQSASVMLGQGIEVAPATAPRGMLVSVKRFAVLAEPSVDQTITYRVRLVRRHGPTALVQGEAEQEGRLLCRGELMLWTDLGASGPARTGSGAPR